MDDALIELERTLTREMPICSAMAIRPEAWDGRQLAVRMPLAANRNHQDSAFAGSLNALCTIVGWGTVYLMLRQVGLAGNIVIRRSEIRYLRPVRCEEIMARGLPIAAEAERHFFELLRSKGHSKVDIGAEVRDAQGALVTFHGAYVVQDA